MVLKPYQQIRIEDHQEPLVPIPLESFAVATPHPYEKLGAPYGDKSPYWLRKTVSDRLLIAQKQLQTHHPGWKIEIFDAYRPIAVQEFMVEYSFIQLAKNQGFNPETLTPEQRQILLEEVYQFWAAPSLDPATPPPHSTGAAVDVTLVDQTGIELNMGSPIDEISARSFPDCYVQGKTPDEHSYHKHRQLLNRIMEFAGFKRHPREWWHFSHGDQLWVWLKVQEGSWHQQEAIAHYGKAL
ncbi:MAG: D-alanyl-D-alanine dipeptidase [Roseofilum sp. Belize BBD 4]|uniref:M15 family metallopeptidase n=1 Tax=Roseofilum sp. Belize BBD 4 TaxID=2821500 RepID=UPI001B01F38B|nr:M15 family metallopeptidase [Roseofilum sp. Belize BBD 4]MBP0033790.1 D-alanyl-D-alanine dipeptidase [Roseofilum sp. Belize BBD 4]